MSHWKGLKRIKPKSDAYVKYKNKTLAPKQTKPMIEFLREKGGLIFTAK